MIEVDDVVVSRPGVRRPILDGVRFRLQEGERAVLLGANGSGKTTLARLLNATLLPNSGRVVVDGFDTREAATVVEVRRRVGLLFQDPDNQFVTTTAEREVAFGLENLATPPDSMRVQVKRALADFDLAGFRQAPPHEMSGGEKARLALACVWVMGSRAVILDETTSLLDRSGRSRLRQRIDSLPSHTAVLEVTTDIEVAAGARRVLLLHDGKLIDDGPPDAVFARLPENVAHHIGRPLVWRIAASLVRSGRAARATCSWETLLGALGGAAGGEKT